MATPGLRWQMLLLALCCLSSVSHAQLAFTFKPNPIIVRTENQLAVNISVNVSGPVPRGIIRFSTKDERVARLPLSNETSYAWPENATTEDQHMFQLTIRGIRLGWTDLVIVFEPNETASNPRPNYLTNDREQVAVLRETNALQSIYRGILIGFVVILVFGMGCTIDIHIVLNLLKRPIGLAVGWGTQFILMPHLGLAVGQLLLLLVQDLDNTTAFAYGIFTLACSPGGGSSNMWTLLFGGDLDLSMTMTFLSQVCAMFMMPLWLFVYSRFYIDSSVRIPFDQVALNLLQLVVPVSIGVLVKLKWPKIANRVSRCIRPFAFIFILYIIGFGTYVNLYLFELIAQLPIIIPFAALLPWLGFLFGYIVAILLRLDRRQAVAIALEAGIQNIGIPILVLQFSMPQPDGSLAAIVPLIVVLVTPIPLYVMLGIKKIRERLNRDRNYELEDESAGKPDSDASAVAPGSVAFKNEALKSGLTVDLSEYTPQIQTQKSTENLVPT